MRKKSPANMAVVSKIPLKPSSMAPYFLNPLVEDTLEDESGESSMVEEASVNTTSSDDEARVDVNQSREGTSVEKTENFNDSVVPGSAKIELLKERTCILCDKVGSLLVCNGRQCPSSYHQECLPDSPSSDDLGNFYCPHCSYKRANAECNRAFKKYRQAKYALFQFLNGMDGDKQKQKAQGAVTKDPTLASYDRNESDTVSKTKLEKDVNAFEPKENGQEEDVNIELGRNIQNNTEALESAVNEQVESQHLDLKSDEMAGYQKESEPLNKVLTERKYENPEISGEHGREEEASFHPVESEFTESLDDSVGMAKKVDVDSDVSISDHEPLTRRQKKLVAQQTQKIKMARLLNFKGNSTSLSAQKSSTKKNAGEKRKKSKTQLRELGWLQTSGGHEREGKTPSDSAKSSQSLIMPDSVEMPKKTGTDSDISGSGKEIQELEKTNKSPLFNYFTYQMALEKEKAQGKSEIVKVLSKSKQVQSFSKSTTLTSSGGRRQKRLWSAEEKEILKEGVLKFSTMTNKNLPWQKIMDFGHNVFDKTRTPTDLKDKWRNILAEETSTGN